MNNIFHVEDFVIFDMEVTNFKLDPKVIVQFSARKYHGNKMVDKLNILIDNKINLSQSFKKRTRISTKLLKNKGIPIDKALFLIRNFIANYTLITYKGNFFYLQMLWFLFDFKLKNHTIDVVDLAKDYNLITDPDKITLEDLCLSLNIDYKDNQWFNSSKDVMFIEKIWFKLKSLLKDKKI